MMKIAICLTYMFICITLSGSKTCQIRKSSGEIKKVCCADYEEKDNDCIPCPIGYVSDTGQKCRPCPKNLYGQKCRYDCSCLDFKICDNVKGCVDFPPTTDYSLYATSYVVDDRTNKWTPHTGADSVNDKTSPYREENTNGERANCNVQGLLFREIIAYSVLSVLVIGFGICLCFVVLKYKQLSKKI